MNPNPLRALTCGPLAAVNDGQAVLSSAPGLGLEPDLSQLQEFAVTF